MLQVSRIRLSLCGCAVKTTKFNGVSYPVQKAAAAIYSDEGAKEVKEVIAYYLENARIILNSLKEQGYTVFGGVNAPYVWVKTKKRTHFMGIFRSFAERS